MQVLAKAIHEGLTESVLEWNSDTMNWLSRLVVMCAVSVVYACASIRFGSLMKQL